MPGERLSMRKIREILRLRWEHHLPQRAIGQSLSSTLAISHRSVGSPPTGCDVTRDPPADLYLGGVETQLNPA
jgi:hypothetical protein